MWDDEMDERFGFERDLDAYYEAFGHDPLWYEPDEEDEEDYEDILRKYEED